jgi:hypothetical protein
MVVCKSFVHGVNGGHADAAALAGGPEKPALANTSTVRACRSRPASFRAPWAALFRMALREADVSHEQAARLMGIPRQWVTAMCAGERGIELAHVGMLPAKAREILVPALVEELRAA